MEYHDEFLPGSRVLVIDYEADVARDVERRLKRYKTRVSLANTGVEGLEVLSAEPVDVVLLDIKIPEMDGIEYLKLIKDKWPNVPVIVTTEHATVESAVHAMKIGAFDFIQKPFEPEEILTIMVAKGLEQRRLLQRYQSLALEVEERYRFENLVGKSRSMREIFKFIERIANSESTALITGESGTGKELVARAIHYNSPRRKTPFVAVDLGSLTENVIESELFGHTKGSFTGAVTDHKGLFRAAEGGTIFLDEVGEIPLKVQAKLLRVIQEREVKPVGSVHPIHVNVRVIAATNRNLEDHVRDGTFREDLYYRLRVMPLHMAPLRERKEDIPYLIRHFIEKHSVSKIKPQFTAKAVETLTSYNWPGNVRELENMIERLLVLSGQTVIIRDEDLPSEVRSSVAPANKMGITLENYERMAIERALNDWDTNIDETAKTLGIAKSTLYRKIKIHGLKIPEKRRKK